MTSILANRLVLNLRSFKYSNSTLGGVELRSGEVLNLGNTEVDSFFRMTYGRRSDGLMSNNHHLVLDAVLGNIGEPLRVGDQGEGDGDEEVKDN